MDREKAKFFKLSSSFNRVKRSDGEDIEDEKVSPARPPVLANSHKNKKAKAGEATPARIPPHPSITYSNSSEEVTEEEEVVDGADGSAVPPALLRRTAKKGRPPQRRRRSSQESDDKSAKKKKKNLVPTRKNPERSARNSADSSANVTSDNTEEEEEEAPVDKSRLGEIPEEVRFDPSRLENKPKGLVDSLSKYFTPGIKRTSRTALNSLIKPQGSDEFREGGSSRPKRRKSCLESRSLSKKDSSSVASSGDERSLGRRRKARSDSEGGHASSPGPPTQKTPTPGSNRERKRHVSSGQSQVRSLYDGLSHLYTDCDSRLRQVAPANYADKQRRKNAINENEDSDHLDHSQRSPDGLPVKRSPARIASPGRSRTPASDQELRPSASEAGGSRPQSDAEATKKKSTDGGTGKVIAVQGASATPAFGTKQTHSELPTNK